MPGRDARALRVPRETDCQCQHLPLSPAFVLPVGLASTLLDSSVVQTKSVDWHAPAGAGYVLGGLRELSERARATVAANVQRMHRRHTLLSYLFPLFQPRLH